MFDFEVQDLAELEKLIAALPENERLALTQIPDIKAHIGAGVELTEKQLIAERLLRSGARHIMLFGGARCVSGDTVLDGHTKTIKELAELGEPVVVKTTWGEQEAEAPFKKGRCKLLRIKTIQNNVIDVTPDHRFWAASSDNYQAEWIKAKDLIIGKHSVAISILGIEDITIEEESRFAKIFNDIVNKNFEKDDTPNAYGHQWDLIEDVEELAEQDFYTLHVPVTEQYFANGFLNHNSGKTFVIIKEIVERALMCESRHAILRFRSVDLVRSIVKDTFPKVLNVCFPGIEGKLNQTYMYYELSNGSQVWFGGLDEKERTDKILGQEYCSIYLNECSQISFDARETVISRLAQNVGIENKMFYDCNPGSKRHWSYLYFIDKIHPTRNQPLKHPEHYVSLQMNPEDNRLNISKNFIEELEDLSEQKRKRFLLGVFSDDDDNALFDAKTLDNGRIVTDDVPAMTRVVVAVDPSGCSGPEDLRSDEVGIVVAGLGTDGRCYILEDLSGRYGPDKWKKIVASAYGRWEADCVVAEVNFGGAMVKEVMRTESDDRGAIIPFRELKASRSKIVRAEPISALFSEGKVSLVGYFTELEAQLCFMTTAGYMGSKSPDRADAMVWAVTSLFPAVNRESRLEKAGKAGHTPKVVLGYSSSKRGRR